MKKLAILSVGGDPLLPTIRNEILKRAGYEVTGSCCDEALRLAHFADGVLLDHSIPRKERESLLAELRKRFPVMPMIVLYNSNEQYGWNNATAALNSLDGPEALLNTLAKAFPKFHKQAAA